MRVEVNLGDDVKVPAPLPESVYHVRCEEATAEDRDGGGQSLQIPLRVLEDGEYQGRVLMYFGTIKPKGDDPDGSKQENTLKYLKKDLLAIGIDMGAEGFDTDDIEGRECLAYCVPNTYQGKEGNRVTALKPLEQAPAKGGKK